MNAQEYISLADQVARQTPELATYDADIAERQPTVDALQASVDAAQADVDTFTEQRSAAEAMEDGEDKVAALSAINEAMTPAQAALTAAQEHLAGPKSELDGIKANANAIRAAIERCNVALQESGLTVDTDAVRLAESKGAMWERIKTERDRRKLDGGYTAAGKWFHSDTFSRTQQIGLVMLGASIPAGTPWKTMDGSFVTMTPTLAQQVFGAAAAQDMATFAAAESHRAAMLASTDPLGYDFSGGWPATFGG